MRRGPRSRGARPTADERPGFRPRFFLAVPTPEVAGTVVSLSSEDARHARTVLRSRPGDVCEVVLEPWRVLVTAVVLTVDGNVTLRLGEPEPGSSPGDAEELAVVLVQALPRPADVDLIVEKGTEVGVDVFLLVPAQGSPPPSPDVPALRVERWRRIATEAAKQSKQLARPDVVLAGSLEEALRLLPGLVAAPIGSRSGAHVVLPPEPASLRPVVSIILEPSAPGSLNEALATFSNERARTSPSELPPALAVWVGPEGGWTDAELAWFAAEGLPVARLGRRILRAQTAGPVAVALGRFTLGDW